MTMGDSHLPAFLARCRASVEAALEGWLPPADIQPSRLHQAMRYACLGGGKRIRPTLVYATAEAVGLSPAALDAVACAVELIHAYSLIHDDLPAMDDDDLRRGRPTCHKAFDDATAILAGDALQALAFQVLAADHRLPGGADARIGMIDTLASACGSRGMAGGQALDLEAEGQKPDVAMLENIHIHKTGALIRASVRMTTLADPDLSADRANRLDRYAKYLGLAFQIRDDILDVEGETSVIGKTRGKDLLQEKATYPAIMGLADARASAQNLTAEALDSLAPFDKRADPLRWIAGFMIRRDR
jgi:farnesyl diphosphate synthase